MKLNDYILASCRFAQQQYDPEEETYFQGLSYLHGMQDPYLLRDIKKLHSLWYLYNQLSTKMSAAAKKKAEESRLDFIILSQKVRQKIELRFKEWISVHESSPYYTGEKYQAVIRGVKDALQRLNQAVNNPSDMNGIMSAISLALNTAHNNGAMADHVGLSPEDLTGLSNQDMSNEDKKIQRFMSHTDAYLMSCCKFAQAQSGENYYNQTDIKMNPDPYLFSDLKTLHSLWYTYNKLSEKKSDIALRKAEDNKAKFYILAQKVYDKIKKRFDRWINIHTQPGWGEHWSKDFLSSLNDPVDTRVFCPALRNYIGKIIAEQDGKLNPNQGKPKWTPADDELLKQLVASASADSFNAETTLGLFWMDQLPYRKRAYEIFATDKQAQDIGYACFIKALPRYVQVRNNVITALDRLEKAFANMQDINGLMSAISLALNTAHNDGIMGEHVGLYEKHLNQLSNQDLSQEDKQLERFMSKTKTYLSSYKFAQDDRDYYENTDIGGQLDPYLFEDLKKMHSLWYMYNQFSSQKMSDIAMRKAEEAKAEFYILAQNAYSKIKRRFQAWITGHVMPGWAQRIIRYYEEEGYIDDRIFCPKLRKYLANIIAHNTMAESIDYIHEYLLGDDDLLGDYFMFTNRNVTKRNENYENELESFRQKLQADGIGDEFEKYKEFAEKRMDLSLLFNPEEIYGDNWIDTDNGHIYHEMVMNIFRSDPTAQKLAYECFSIRWPRYGEVAQLVIKALERMDTAFANMQDMNGLMSAISLALNTAHNTGLMSEHVGLFESELDELSNQDLSQEDQQLKRFMSVQPFSLHSNG